MPGRTRIACLIVALALAAAGAGAGEAHAVILKRLDFESGNFRQWTDIQAVTGGARIVRAPVRQGRYAARFIVRPGDRPVMGGERAEVMFATGEGEGTESWWQWSTYFPTGFHPNSGDHNVFTQWHHTRNFCPPLVSFAVDTGTRPARLKMGVRGGRLNTNTCDPGDHRVWKFASLRRNRWYNFTFHVKWSSSHSIGFVELRLNGRVVIQKTHTATLYQGMSAYVKQGFYRNPSGRTTVIYHDGLRRFRP